LHPLPIPKQAAFNFGKSLSRAWSVDEPSNKGKLMESRELLYPGLISDEEFEKKKIGSH